MNSKEALTELFNEANRLSSEKPKYTTYNLWEMCKQIQKDLEALEILKESITYQEEHKYIMKEEMKGEKFMIFQHAIKGTEKVDKIKEWLNG